MRNELEPKPREHPILFSGEMVRAILAGKKTQTRRIVQPPPDGDDLQALEAAYGWEFHTETNQLWCLVAGDQGYEETSIRSPYGQLGDKLWVRETWKVDSFMEEEPVEFQYKADGAVLDEEMEGMWHQKYDAWYNRICEQSMDDCKKAGLKMDEFDTYHWKRGASPCRWRPSIYMPRWASRILLEVTDVRVERLQDISAGDCVAEGMSSGAEDPCDIADEVQDRFRDLWNELNAKRGFGWDANPFVWVVGFRRVE